MLFPGHINSWYPIETAEIALSHLLSSLRIGDGDDGKYLIQSSTVQFFPEFYEASHSLGPSTITLEMKSVDTSTFHTTGNAWSTETGAELYSVTAHVICTDPKTKKGKSLPAKIEDVMRSVESKEPICQLPHLVKPGGQEYHTVSTEVLPSDMGFDGHLSQEAFVRLCHNVGSILAHSGRFTHVNHAGELSLKRMKSLECTWYGEALCGDKLASTCGRN